MNFSKTHQLIEHFLFLLQIFSHLSLNTNYIFWSSLIRFPYPQNWHISKSFQACNWRRKKNLKTQLLHAKIFLIGDILFYWNWQHGFLKKSIIKGVSLNGANKKVYVQASVQMLCYNIDKFLKAQKSSLKR